MSTSPDNEPRADLRQILSALVAGLVRVTPDRDLQVIFEQQLQRQLSMQSVRLREIPSRYQARLVTPTRTTNSIVLGVPTANPRVQAVLEVYFEPGRPIEDADFEMLESAADLGGLVLEAARTRAVLRRCTTPDGAAPLIGSTPVMKDLRDRIERVALTDFTVLIDGETSR